MIDEKEDSQIEETTINKLAKRGSAEDNKDTYLEEISRLIKFANQHPIIISCLYDCGLMPEQCPDNSYEQYRMALIIAHFEVCIKDLTKKET